MSLPIVFINVRHFFPSMHVFIERTKEQKDVSAASVRELLTKLQIVPDEVLVMCNGRLATEDESLADDDKIKVLSVISGG